MSTRSYVSHQHNLFPAASGFAAMDAVVGVDSQQNLRKEERKPKKPVKVVYISSPMKVKTSASRFRALVQELTGQNSDVARYMEANGGDQFVSVDDCESKSPESMVESCNDWLIQGAVDEGSSGGMVDSLWLVPSQLGELRSYGAV